MFCHEQFDYAHWPDFATIFQSAGKGFFYELWPFYCSILANLRMANIAQRKRLRD